MSIYYIFTANYTKFALLTKKIKISKNNKGNYDSQGQLILYV